MVVVKFNQAQEVQLASQILDVDASELSLIPQISQENYDFDEIVMIYKDYLKDNTVVCSCCREVTEPNCVMSCAGDRLTPPDYDSVCECGNLYSADKPSLEEWFFINQ